MARSDSQAARPTMSRSAFLKTAAVAGAVVGTAGHLKAALADATEPTAQSASRAVTTDEVAAAIDPSADTLAEAGIGHNFAAHDACDSEVGGLTTFSGGRLRPAPHTGHPSPMTTGHVGPNAMPILPVEAPSTWDYEADIAIVGGGYGGTTAAAWASQHGFKAVLVEKNTETGGASAHSAFNVSIIGGSKLQIENGYFWPGDTFDTWTIVNELNNLYDNSVDIDLLRSTVTASPVWFDWMMQDEKADWVNIGSRYGIKEVIEGTATSVLGNKYATDLLTNNAIEAGATVLVSTQAVALVVDGGRVVGLKCRDLNEHKDLYVRGEQGVILTAGHFGMNLDLLEQYCPSAYMQCAVGGPMPWATGECFRMGIGVGADVSGYNSWSGWDGAADEYWGSGSGNYWSYFWSGERQLAKNPWLLLNVNCERLPYFVSSGNAAQRGSEFQPGFWTRCQGMGDNADCTAWNAAIGNRSYCIFDDDYQTNVWKFRSAHTSADKGRIPVTTAAGLKDEQYVTCDWVGEFEAAIERGAAFKADTLEELAELVGLDPDKLVAAVESWNETVASGDDSDFTPQYMPDWLVPVQKPPFYCIPNSTQIAKIMTGLRVNGGMQVLNPHGEAIPGLYAGFFTAGGICGESDYGGVFGNPTLACGAAISGIGGLMAVRSALGDPITEDDWCEEARELNDAARAARSEKYLASAADGSYMQGKEVPQMVLDSEAAGSQRMNALDSSDPTGPLADGTYTGSGVGVGGEIDVTIEVKDGTISVTDISPNNETKGIGGYEAIEDGTFAALVDEAQGSGFDAVSGATRTSEAIQAAVRDAMNQAAGA